MRLNKCNTLSVLLTSCLISYVNPLQAADRILITSDTQLTTMKSLDINRLIGLSNQYEFKSVKKVTLSNSNHKHKINQYYLKIPVYGYSLASTQLKNGTYQDFSGAYLANIEKDIKSVTPTITQDKAMRLAKSRLLFKKNTQVTNEEISLYIKQDKNNIARLVYVVSFIVNASTPSRPYFIIDAHSGDVLEQWEGLTTRDATGPGGNLKTGQYYYGRDYGYLLVTDDCRMDSPNVATIDLKNATSGGAIHQFICPENTYKFTNGAYSPLNDAHYFGNVVFAMYKTWFNTAPLNMKLIMRVHFAVNYENAFWDGQQMTFGDGAYTFYPLISLDVVSHEVSHGFTEQNSGLQYASQSGGINESFSDIAGESAEYFFNANKPIRNDWLVGAAIFKNGIALRYFQDPTRDGRSIGHASNFYEGLDVHYSSGVFNRAFYLLANTANWNTEKAFRAFVLANQIYWNQLSRFNDASCGVAKAAGDLNYNVQDVINAFNVVGVNDSTCVLPPFDKELKRGVPIANLSAVQGNNAYYYVDVPAGTAKLRIRTFGGTGDADLYVQYGQKPTTTVYQCRPYTAGNNEKCTFVPPQAGRYYVMLNAYANYSGVTIVAE